MPLNTIQLLAELKGLCQDHIQKAKEYKMMNDEALNHRPNTSSWNVLECIEHLNRYAEFYVPEIKSSIGRAKPVPRESFKPGWLGDYFAKSMYPSSTMKKIKTFKSKDPIFHQLDKTVIDTFVDYNMQFFALLSEAGRVDIQSAKTAVSISPFIKLRLGDTLRFVVYHQLRHMVQIERILAGQ